MEIYTKKARYLKPGDRIVGDDRPIHARSYLNNGKGQYWAFFEDGSFRAFELDEKVSVYVGPRPQSGAIAEFSNAKSSTADPQDGLSTRQRMEIRSLRQRTGRGLDSGEDEPQPE